MVEGVDTTWEDRDDAAGGQRSSDSGWVNLVYDELRRLAGFYLSKERAGHTLQPTALVHEAYIKLMARVHADRPREDHFRALAASAMRQVLIDHARQRLAQKRGGDWLRITFDDAAAVAQKPDVDLMALDEAMQELAGLDERKSRVVEMRFYGGMTCAEIARILSISPKTVESDWYMARAWLRRRLSGANDDQP